MYGNETMAEEMLVLLRDQPPDDEEIQEELYVMLQVDAHVHVRMCMCACACARVHVRMCMCACACAHGGTRGAST